MKFLWNICRDVYLVFLFSYINLLSVYCKGGRSDPEPQTCYIISPQLSYFPAVLSFETMAWPYTILIFTHYDYKARHSRPSMRLFCVWRTSLWSSKWVLSYSFNPEQFSMGYEFSIVCWFLVSLVWMQIMDKSTAL